MTSKRTGVWLMISLAYSVRGEDSPAPGVSSLVESPAVRFGGEGRLRYEYFENASWGTGPQDKDGYGLYRMMLNADIALAPQWRSFLEVKSGLLQGREGGARPTDEDRLDLHQAYLEPKWSLERNALEFRLGRQELAYGSSRLLSTRESPNVRLSFDAARLRLQLANVQIDTFIARPVSTSPRLFDDRADRSRTLWGLYLVNPLNADRTLSLDLYYLMHRREQAVFARGKAVEERHTGGFRVAGKRQGVDFNTEAILQVGRFGNQDILAWTIATDHGYTLTTSPWRPRWGLKANLSSGDRPGADRPLGTFNAMYPRGSYFGEIGLLGPANLMDLQPSLGLQLRPNLTALATWGFFWRTETSDGIYGPSLNLIHAPTAAASGRAIGDSPSLLMRWGVTSRLTLTTTAAVFRAGKFLHQSGAGSDVYYFSAWMTFVY